MENKDLRNIDPKTLSKEQIIELQKYLIIKNFNVGSKHDIITGI